MARTRESGAAMLANDMHLSIAVPIIWYRASLVFPDPAAALNQPADSPASRCPASPVSSSAATATSRGDSPTPAATGAISFASSAIRAMPTKYLTPDGPKAFDVFNETIAAKGAAAKTVPIRWTIWGPIVWKDARGREYAQRWVAHDAQSLAADITKPERARSVDDCWQAVAGLGIPNQNVTMADTSGRIAWTIGGAIPRRIGHDGMTPESWADGTHRWDGYLTARGFPAHRRIRRTAASGPRTRRSSMARCSRRSARAAMPTAFARG